MMRQDMHLRFDSCDDTSTLHDYKYAFHHSSCVRPVSTPQKRACLKAKSWLNRKELE